jgi:sarcosine oxidase delta subunit
MRSVLEGDKLASDRLNQGKVEISLLSVKAVGRRTVIAESRFLYQISPFGICGEQSGVRTNFFSKYFGFLFHQCRSPGQRIDNWKHSKNQRCLGNWGIMDRNALSVRLKGARKMRNKRNAKIAILQHEH